MLQILLIAKTVHKRQQLLSLASRLCCAMARLGNHTHGPSWNRNKALRLHSYDVSLTTRQHNVTDCTCKQRSSACEMRERLSHQFRAVFRFSFAHSVCNRAARRHPPSDASQTQRLLDASRRASALVQPCQKKCPDQFCARSSGDQAERSCITNGLCVGNGRERAHPSQLLAPALSGNYH